LAASEILSGGEDGETKEHNYYLEFAN